MNHILVFCEKSQNYPNVPISHFQLTEIVKNGNTGYLSTESMLYFQNILQTEAKNLIGSPMVFELVERLRKVLSDYNKDATKGLFSLFPRDIVIEVFKLLDARDLCAIALTNKYLQQMSEINLLWVSLLEQDRIRYDKSADFKDGDLKRLWLKHHGYVKPQKMTFLASVLNRKNTGEAQFDITIAMHEAEKFTSKFEFTKFGNIIYVPTHSLVGHWIFIKRSKIDSVKATYGTYIKMMEEQFESDQSMDKSNQSQISQQDFHTAGRCDYVEQAIGYIAWEVDRWYLDEISAIFVRISRGYVVHCPSKFLMRCIHREAFRLSELANVVFQYTSSVNSPKSCPFLVTVYSQTTCKYLNDIVKLINKRMSQTSTGQFVTLSMRPTEFQFILGNIENKVGEGKIWIWTYNSSELPILISHYLKYETDEQKLSYDKRYESMKLT